MNPNSYSIILIEFDGHWDSADGFCRFLAGSGHRLTVMTDSYVYNSLRHYPYSKEITFLLKSDDEKRGAFLAKHQQLLSSCDLLFINTIHENFKDFIHLPLNVLTVLRVHNTFKQFKPLSHIHIPFGLFYFKKGLSYIGREIVLARHFKYLKIVNERIDYFTFLSESITAYAVEHHLVPLKKVMFSIPLLPWEGKIYHKPNDRIEISIVGALERRKKDYGLIVDTFAKLFDSTSKFRQPVRLNLLGRSAGKYGHRIIKQLTDINHPQFSINYYEKEAPVIEFDRILASTHIIISPVRVENITQIYKEIYGKTKFTASVGTIMQFQAIGVFPDDFSYDKDFEPFFRKYMDADSLVFLLNELFENTELILHEINSLQDFLVEKYDKQKILQKLEQFIATNKNN